LSCQVGQIFQDSACEKDNSPIKTFDELFAQPKERNADAPPSEDINAVAVGVAAAFGLPSATAATGKRILHEFTGGTDGAFPQVEPITDGRNNYYGVTAGGGSSNCEDGCGTVYRLYRREVTILYAFTGGEDGYLPYGPLLLYNREFYGVTAGGGANDKGTVYKISRDGIHTVLYSFVGGAEGGGPSGALVADGDGNLYGIAGGGIGDGGTIYKLTPNGDYSVLHAFDPLQGEGTLPSYGLVAASDGNFYGTTIFGGTGGVTNARRTGVVLFTRSHPGA
jgi:uncharacterized repeat protein (TIGR03803 family)